MLITGTFGLDFSKSDRDQGNGAAGRKAAFDDIGTESIHRAISHTGQIQYKKKYMNMKTGSHISKVASSPGAELPVPIRARQ